MPSQAARKRLRRHLQLAPVECSIPDATDEDNTDFVPELAEDIRNRLGIEAEALWNGWMRQLAKCAKRLDSQGCWQFYRETRNAAICWGLEGFLTQTVILAAEQFSRAGAAKLIRRKRDA